MQRILKALFTIFIQLSAFKSENTTIIFNIEYADDERIHLQLHWLQIFCMEDNWMKSRDTVRTSSFIFERLNFGCSGLKKKEEKKAYAVVTFLFLLVLKNELFEILNCSKKINLTACKELFSPIIMP